MKKTLGKIAAIAAIACLAQAEGLQIDAPAALPRNCPLFGYSPLVRVHYTSLQPEDYVLKVWLLETGHYNLGSTQWSPHVVRVPANKAERPAGDVVLNFDMDVFDHAEFLWVARLYNRAGLEVASAQSSATSVSTRPALLARIDTQSAHVGKPLQLALRCSAPKADSVRYRVQDAPPGAVLDPTTGVFTWTPTTAGTFHVLAEVVTGESKLADAQLVSISVSEPTK